MFRGGQPNPYDDIVGKATDENLTGENWEIILELCDKVQDEGEQGARNVMAAILKRLAHRNPNVQIYTLSLVESLTKNCGIDIHREVASRAFTQGLERVVMDRNTHDKVRRKATGLIAMWTQEFEKDSTLGVMDECYQNLKSKGYKFDAPQEPPPPDVDDDVRRREEEELQRVLEMSLQDKGGRGQWAQYSLAGAGSSSSAAKSSAPAVPPSSSKAQPNPQSQPQPQAQSQPPPTYGGYVPSANPPATADLATTSTATSTATPTTTATSVASPSYKPASPVPSHESSQDTASVVTRVRALHTFEPTESGELAFEKGDIIKVVDRGYKDWWRGQLKGRTGIFPVNYVEPLPEPTANELAKEAEKEAAVFNQAANVDRLLILLRELDPTKDNLADNEEIQELYRQCMSLRPKIVKLIDKYNQKRADLVSMNETFVKARTIFDSMMEESLARHSAAIYDGRPDYARSQSQPYNGHPDPRAEYAHGYGWNPYDPSGYNAYPGTGPQAGYPTDPGYARQGYPTDPHAAAAAYPGYGQPVGPQPYGAPGPVAAPYGGPEVPTMYPQQAQQPHDAQGYPQQLSQPPVGVPQQQQQQPLQAQQLPADPAAAAPQAHPVASPQPQPEIAPQPIQQQAAPTAAQPQVQPLQYQPQVQQQTQPLQFHTQPQVQQQTQPLQFQAQPQPEQQHQPVQQDLHTQSQAQTQPQQQPQVQAQVQQQQQQPQAQPQQAQAQPQPQAQQEQQPQPHEQATATGAPQHTPQGYVFDPKATYPDPNVQAWAQYYAQGGTDPTGSVYFISVPGIKEDPNAAAAVAVSPAADGSQQQQYGYGASPYATSTSPDPNAQGQHQAVQSQFAGLSVADPSQQGVGAPA